MSEAPSREYGRRTVSVRREGDKLTLHPSTLDLHDWEWVEWTFDGLQEDEICFISFPSPQPRLGPFHALRSCDSRCFLGKGNKGPRQPGNDYDYVALVLAPGSPAALARSPEPGTLGAGKIRNLAIHVNTAPEILVEYVDPNVPGAPATLTVTPDPAGLNRGDTATWRFQGLPENAFACFKFLRDANTPDLPTSTGPFLAFNACDSDPRVVVEASAMGFAAHYPDPRTHPSFRYNIEIRGWDGQLLASHDPMIDNLGPPPPTRA